MIWSVSTRAPDVCHVGHEQRADLLRNLVQALVIPLARVGRATADEHLGPEVQRLLLQLVVVDVARLRASRTMSGLEDNINAEQALCPLVRMRHVQIKHSETAE
jgi:hypothetical protein